MKILDKLLNRPTIEMTPEQKLTQVQIDEIKRLRRKETTDRLRSQMGFVFKSAMPHGIRNPDSLITNMHLYAPPRDGKKHTTRLF